MDLKYQQRRRPTSIFQGMREKREKKTLTSNKSHHQYLHVSRLEEHIDASNNIAEGHFMQKALHTPITFKIEIIFNQC